MAQEVSDLFVGLPKIELHLHLDCSISFNVVRQLGKSITEEEFGATFSAPEKCDSLKHYLDAIGPSCDLLQSHKALKMATIDLVKTLDSENVLYAEIRFAPQVHTRNGLDLNEVLEAVLEGIDDTVESRSIVVGVILCALRPESRTVGLQIIELANKYRNRGVVGVDLAGDEAGHSIDEQIDVFKKAHELNLNTTAHAGEALGAESVIETLSKLNVLRIGHGVRSIEDPRAIELLKSRNIHLEICPSSNIQVGVFEKYSDHPIDQLSKLGVSLSVNTDARTVANLSLSKEYERLHLTFGWNADDFLAHNLEAIKHAFIPEIERDRLTKLFLERWEVALGSLKTNRDFS